MTDFFPLCMGRIYLFLYVSHKFFVETEHLRLCIVTILKITFFTSPQACCWWCLSFLLLTAYLVTSQFYKVCIFGCVGLLLSSLLGWVSVQLTIRSFPFIAFAEGSLCWNILSVLWQTVYTFLPLDLCTAACVEVTRKCKNNFKHYS